MVGEVGRIKQRERGARENVALLGGFEFFTDQRRALQADLDGVMTRGLEPLDQPGDLGGSARAVGSFHHDELPGELLDFHAGQAQTEEALRRDLRDEYFGLVRGCGFGFPGHGSNYLVAVKVGRSIRFSTRRRTSPCCSSMRWLASMTTKLNSVLMARYCSKIRPWKIRKLS